MIKLKPSSWKIMLEVLVKANPVKVVEVPIQFNERTAGESKFTLKQMKAYIWHIVLLGIHKYKALLRFGIVGSGAAVIHFLLLYLLTDFGGLWYIGSAALSIIAASTFAYTIHHRWTFEGRSIPNHFTGWIKYQFVSGASDLLYIGMLALFVELAGLWYMAGAFVSALIVYPIKYTIAGLVIWKGKTRDPNAPDYDWISFYKGNTVQRWWKGRIANIIWSWVPNSSFLLDIGCGSSPIITRCSNALGVDTNKEKIRFMEQKVNGSGVKFAVVDGTNTKLTGESCDHILCIEVIEHAENSEEVIKEMSRLLKPRGRAVIATPDYSRKWWLLAEKFTPAGKAHVKRYTRESLEAECRKFGLEPVKHKYVAGCDLVEMFVKKEERNGHYSDGKLATVKVGLEIIKRMAKPRISRANFAVTYMCNQECKSCNIWQMYRKKSRAKEEVKIEEFESILENNELMWLSLTGGEPFLREEIGDMLELCLQKLKITSIVTNGSRPEFIESCVRQSLAGEGMLTVSVSIEGSEEVHDEFVGKNGAWNKAIETLDRLSLIKCDRLKVGIEQLVTSKVPIESFENVKKIAKAMDVRLTYTMEQAALFYGNVESRVNGAEAPETQLKLEPFSVLSKLFVTGVGKSKKACVAGEYSCFIDPYCMVYPCLFFTPTEPLVNLRENGYRIGKLDCKELVEECKGCWTPCEAYAAMIFKPWKVLV